MIKKGSLYCNIHKPSRAAVVMNMAFDDYDGAPCSNNPDNDESIKSLSDSMKKRHQEIEEKCAKLVPFYMEMYVNHKRGETVNKKIFESDKLNLQEFLMFTDAISEGGAGF